MNDITILTIAALSIMAIIGGMSYAIITRQQRTIDNLTDKLMARSYVEYKSMNRVKEEDASPPREDEPISWHDH